MSTDLARLQFATTSIYHFLFVPVTIGLSLLVALLQTSWYRNQNPEFRRLTRFFGTLLLINVAIGTVTGLVQEFEFGMNWSNYSRLVGNIFGGPLAMEGLVAFFLESTFLGIWIFGWDKLSKRLHLACIWLVAARIDPVGRVHHGSEFLDAASCRLRDERRTTTRAHQRVGALHQSGVPLVLSARDPGVIGDRVAGHARRLGVAPPSQEPYGGLPQDGGDLTGGAGAGRAAEHVRRQRARSDRGQVPAHEDRGRGSAVDHVPLTLFVLAAADRRRQERRDTDADHRSARPALDPWQPITSTAKSKA